jgi:hypothetical protein
LQIKNKRNRTNKDKLKTSQNKISEVLFTNAIFFLYSYTKIKDRTVQIAKLMAEILCKSYLNKQKAFPTEKPFVRKQL